MLIRTTTVEILDRHDVLEIFVRSFFLLLTIVQSCYLKGFKTIQAFRKNNILRELWFSETDRAVFEHLQFSRLSYFDLIVVFIIFIYYSFSIKVQNLLMWKLQFLYIFFLFEDLFYAVKVTNLYDNNNNRHMITLVLLFVGIINNLIIKILL